MKSTKINFKKIRLRTVIMVTKVKLCIFIDVDGLNLSEQTVFDVTLTGIGVFG